MSIPDVSSNSGVQEIQSLFLSFGTVDLLHLEIFMRFEERSIVISLQTMAI